LKSKTEFKNQTNGKVRVDTYFPIGKLTAKSVNSKVYHKAPQQTTDAGLYPGALRILFYVLCVMLKEPVDIKYIIRLAEEQHPDRHDVINALKGCKNGHWTSNGYYRFIDSTNANQPNSEWQYEESIVLEQEGKKDIIIDLLKDGRIGGLEFLDFIY
jgi:hypothetical protein